MQARPARHLSAGAALIFAVSAGAATHASVAAPEPTAAAPRVASPAVSADELVHSFYFTRAIYTSAYGRSRWATDYPKADQQFLTVLRRLTGIDAYPLDHVIRLDDPELRRLPFIYAVEVGSMGLRDSEVQGLRDYLLAGGFLVIDDFWGSQEWRNFESQIRRVLPEFDIVEIPLDHAIFSTVYQIDEIIQVPNVGQGMAGGPTHERDGYVPHVRGIFDDRGRLMVVINWNTDLGDAWEWAEQARYPLRFSTYAYQMGANFIVYAMTH